MQYQMHFNPAVEETFPTTRSGVNVNLAVRRFIFENGYGASVVSPDVLNRYLGWYVGQDAPFELAVIVATQDSDMRDAWDYEICYNTPVARDVRSYLTESEVQEILAQIAGLPAVDFDDESKFHFHSVDLTDE